MKAIIQIQFKGEKALTFTVEETWYFEVKTDIVDFALHSHKEVPELKAYSYARPGSYRIPLKDLRFAGLQYR